MSKAFGLQVDETTQAALNEGARWYKRQSDEIDDGGELVEPPPPPQPLTTDEKTVKIFNMIVDNGYVIPGAYFLPKIKEIIEA